LADICHRQAAMYLRVAAMAPALEMQAHFANGRIEVEVANAGYLPTYVLDSAKKLALDARVLRGGRAARRLHDRPARCAHRGRATSRAGAAASTTSTSSTSAAVGSVSRRTVSIPVQGHGKVRVRAKGLRVGEVVQEIAVG